MKLIDIISLIDENDNISVQNTEHIVIAKYDGKNSIPDTLNDRIVTGIGRAGELNEYGEVVGYILITVI